MASIEDQIRKAIEDGQFDNLSGKGKPLKLDENPHENPEWRLTYIMLKNSGFSLPWIETRREIEEEIESIQAEFKRLCNNRQPEGLPDPGWARAVVAYRLRIREINQRILRHNLSVPSALFQRLLIDEEPFLGQFTTTDKGENRSPAG